jgi:fatty acid desaturase
MKIFKNSTLDFFLVLYAVIGFLFPFIVSTFNVWVWVLLTPIQVLLVVTALNTSMHYHMHNPLFLNRYLNRFFEIFSSMFTLIPFQLWKYFHVAHHRYNNDIKKNNIVKDPVSFYRYGKNNQRENVW